MTLAYEPLGLGFLDAPALAAPEAAPRRSDVLVIGAGINGLLTARSLLAEGLAVTVVEAYTELGRLASGLNNGKVTVAQGQQLSKIAKVAGRDAALAYATQQHGAVESMRGLCAGLGVAFDVRRAGLFVEGDDASAVEAEHDLLSAAGLEAVLESGSGYARHAVLVADQMQINPHHLLAALARDVGDRGGVIVGGQRVRKVRGRGGLNVATTGTGHEFAAADVVVATGAPIVDRGAHFARLSPQRSYEVAFTGPRVVLDSALRADSGTRSVRDVSQGPYSLLIGGAGHRVGQTWSERRSVADIVAWAKKWFPAHTAVAQWSAQDYLTHDHQPIIEQVASRAGRVVVVTGMNKWGLTNGWVAAQEVTEAVLGRRTLPSAQSGLAGELSSKRVFGLARDNLQGGLGSGLGVCKALADAASSPRGAGLCTHLGGPLVRNDSAGSLDCSLHGSRFSADGEVLEGYATRPAPTVGG